ncbi:MAG TPA: helix-turn-helix domain-containing protein [Xanthomonadales bacterium]|nr:helix-turn-helix domain-containing protein [Xanthomonadales bacterium]
MPAQAASHETTHTTPVTSKANGRSATQKSAPPTLRETVRNSIRNYLEDMGDSQAEDLYQILLSEVEPPLLEEVLRFTGHNQSRAARILGITRNTLRAKLLRYDIPLTNGKHRGL